MAGAEAAGERVMPGGYDKTYEQVKVRLRDCDFSGAVRRLGFVPGPGGALTIDFLGRGYRLSREGVFPLDGEPADPNFLSVLVYYAISAGDAEPGSDFALPHHFARGLVSGGTGLQWMTAPLRRAFGGDYRLFCRAASRLGLVYEGSPGNGEHHWRYRLLPRIPVKLVYYEADDEFPVDIKIFYEKTAAAFLEFEPLAFLNGCFIKTLTCMAGRCSS
jgi:hypothetical protein